ncbi:MAG: dihydroorotate dehydrogenase [Alphaproteobacteria bacterium]
MVDLGVSIGAMALANPVMPASGTFAEGLEKIIELGRLGALVTKTITREKRIGNPTPRVVETFDGMLNSIGIPSKGIPHFVEHTLPLYARHPAPLVVSISAPTAEGFASLAAEISGHGIAAIEANISCPNLEEDGQAFAMTPESTAIVVAKLRRATQLPLWVKLTPNTGDITRVALAAQEAGADALVVANTVLAMSIDVDTFRPSLGNIMGGLSGPAIKPLIVRLVYQCARAVRIPVIGCGGIMNTEDAVEYLLAGASAIQVGTANFIHPAAMVSIIEGLSDFCERRGLARVSELIGAVDIGGTGEDERGRMEPTL